MFRPRVVALLLVLITILAYLPVLHNGFLGFDDETYFSQNEFIQCGISWASLKWAFTSFYASNWHPLTWVTYMVSFDLFRLNPAGHHLINVLFHAANACLVFILILRLTGKLWTGAFVAALFAWHPLHVESVAWVAELKDVTSTFWGLLSLLAYVRYAGLDTTVATLSSQGSLDADSGPSIRHEYQPLYYWLALFFFALSLMSKSMLVTLPFIMLLLDFWPLHRTKAPVRCLVEKIPFLLLAIGVCLLTVQAQKNTAMASFATVPFSLRVDNAVVAYAGYLWNTIWPMNLTILYPLPDQVPPLTLMASAVTLAGISIAVLLGSRRWPWLSVGWLWYLGTLVPVIGLVQVGSQSMADRYTYFPLIGIFLAVGLSVSATIKRWPLAQTLWASLAIVILAGCVILTERQLGYWRNTETIFGRSLELDKNNPLAHLVLGQAYEKSQQLDKAMSEYQQALRLSNAQANIYHSIGRLLATEGKREEALKYYRQALKLRPGSPTLHDSIGVILIEEKQYEEAKQEFNEALRLDSDYSPARFRLGWILLKQGNDVDAISQLKKVAQLDPNNLQVIIFVASVLATDEAPKVRDGNKAVNLAERSAQITDSKEPSVLDTLAAAYAEAGRFEEAVTTEQKAIELANNNNLPEEISNMKKHLELYQKRTPWRQSFTDESYLIKK